MFKKILQSLSKSQAAPKPAAAPVKPQAPVAVKEPPAQVQPKAASAPAPAVAASKTPEELCDIAPKSPKDQVQARLKLLYRRYNRGASSLDPKIRAEADQMLHAIVLVREKYFGEI